ncbi:hypothetical protein V2A60_005350 [Cordyceps javanica]|uniref:tripeptidyl-peptidase II n=1 Tax=Cordyceps javanica TaxID=43265 RepID=A0A545VDY6_9HYPO|nr:tripeptidyl peptidase SED3 [Cordyceps javanica]TQW10396.1 tripeptidyl peptidase SED3 [Cordyceps javanica]
MSFSSFLLVALVTSASARNVVLETVSVLPLNWKQLDDVIDPTWGINFSIALKQPMVDIATLMANGGRHLSLDEVQALRTPDLSYVNAVMRWLKDENITNATLNQDLVHVQTTIAEAERLLDGTFSRYIYDGKIGKLRTQKYSIPEELIDAISFIYPVANFMKPAPNSVHVSNKAVKFDVSKRNETASRNPCSDSMGVDCFKKRYNMTYESPDRNSPVRFGISGYLELNANHDDVNAFLTEQTNITNYNYSVEKVNGGEDPGTPAGAEAVFDLAYGMALGYPAAVTFYATGGRGDLIGRDGQIGPYNESSNEPYLEFINYLLDKPDDEVPHVLSVSYGDDELSVPREYAKRVCDAYGLLTKRGTSIIHASGDGGSTGGQYGDCKTRDGKQTNTTMPTFPATCPWVTAVGGTDFKTDPHEAIAFSSGGFSFYFDRPSWQTGAVTKYIERLGGHLDGYYNKNGRAMPDVSTAAGEYRYIRDGQAQDFWGTSASAPTFAAMIVQVNDARLRDGKQSIGYLNEILYSKAGVAALTDVTKGKSYRCAFASGGWPARPGWDAVTGLGEPRDFSKLMKLLYDA